MKRNRISKLTDFINKQGSDSKQEPPKDFVLDGAIKTTVFQEYNCFKDKHSFSFLARKSNLNLLQRNGVIEKFKEDDKGILLLDNQSKSPLLYQKVQHFIIKLRKCLDSIYSLLCLINFIYSSRNLMFASNIDQIEGIGHLELKEFKQFVGVKKGSLNSIEYQNLMNSYQNQDLDRNKEASKADYKFGLKHKKNKSVNKGKDSIDFCVNDINHRSEIKPFQKCLFQIQEETAPSRENKPPKRFISSIHNGRNEQSKLNMYIIQPIDKYNMIQSLLEKPSQDQSHPITEQNLFNNILGQSPDKHLSRQSQDNSIMKMNKLKLLESLIIQPLTKSSKHIPKQNNRYLYYNEDSDKNTKQKKKLLNPIKKRYLQRPFDIISPEKILSNDFNSPKQHKIYSYSQNKSQNNYYSQDLEENHHSNRNLTYQTNQNNSIEYEEQFNSPIQNEKKQQDRKKEFTEQIGSLRIKRARSQQRSSDEQINFYKQHSNKPYIGEGRLSTIENENKEEKIKKKSQWLAKEDFNQMLSKLKKKIQENINIKQSLFSPNQTNLFSNNKINNKKQ